MCMNVHICTRIHIHIYTYTYSYIHTFIHIYTSTYTHTHTHTHIHTHTHTHLEAEEGRKNGVLTVEGSVVQRTPLAYRAFICHVSYEEEDTCSAHM
jgi:hypothetical protein